MPHRLTHALDLPLAPFVDGQPQDGGSTLGMIAYYVRLSRGGHAIFQLYPFPQAPQSRLVNFPSHFHLSLIHI
jgi:hypothetical protein